MVAVLFSPGGINWGLLASHSCPTGKERKTTSHIKVSLKMMRFRQPESSIDSGKTENAEKEVNKGPGPEAGQGGCVKQNTLVRGKT